MRNVKIVAGTAPQLTFLFSFTPIVLIHSLFQSQQADHFP